jgi:hypothetical protein
LLFPVADLKRLKNELFFSDTMKIIPYIQVRPTPYYSPDDYQSSCTFTLQPGERVLVTLDHHDPLEHVVTRSVCGEKNGSVTWHYVSPDKVGLLVVNNENSFIFARKSTPLTVLLKDVRSHFVIVSQDEKILCRCHLPPHPSPDDDDDDSCDSKCDHSDIDHNC